MNEDELIQKTRRLIRRWDNIRIVGAGWAGDTRRGFQFNPVQASFSPAGTTPPPPTSGACCPEEGDCFISTQSICEAGGGTYQGDDTTCDPDPCPPKGACCVGTDCSIETEDDCTGMGGTYQGDDTTCDPNPCSLPTCSACAFLCDGVYYSTRTTVASGNTHLQISGDPNYNDWDFSCTKIDTCNGDGTTSCFCLGSGSISSNGVPFSFFTAECDCTIADTNWITDLGGCCWLPAGGLEPAMPCAGPSGDCHGYSYSGLVCGDYTINGTSTITYSNPCTSP